MRKRTARTRDFGGPSPRRIDPELDTPELAELVREGMKGPYVPHKNGDLQRLFERVNREVAKSAKSDKTKSTTRRQEAGRKEYRK